MKTPKSCSQVERCSFAWRTLHSRRRLIPEGRSFSFPWDHGNEQYRAQRAWEPLQGVRKEKSRPFLGFSGHFRLRAQLLGRLFALQASESVMWLYVIYDLLRSVAATKPGRLVDPRR
jgi:hypothetical protein